MKKTVYFLSQEVKPYTLDLATKLNAIRAFAAQPNPVKSIGSTGLRHTHSMGGNEGSRR